jgi:membrane protein DedA with SNARE-associated domain
MQPMMASISGALVNEIAHFVREAGLPGIFVLMAISAACIPIPSEVVMLFAGFAVAEPAKSASSHHLTMLGIVLAGVLGSMVGSYVAYGVGRGGRLELMERGGAKFKWIPTHPSQIERADRWFARYGNWAVLFGRLVPFVRAFVSLPAGVSKMPLLRFSVLSLIGTIPWVLVLALAGDAVGSEWTKIRSGFEYVDYVIVIAIVAAIVWALVRRRGGPRRAQVASQGTEEPGVEVAATHPGTDITG